MILLNDMKKFILALLFLVAGISLNNVYAKDTNALLIGDCRVTLDKVQSGGSFTSNIRPTGLTSGTITYDNSTRTLVLDNITFDITNSTASSAIDNIHIDGLTIYVKGTCNIISPRPEPLFFSSNTTITGYDYHGKLNVTSSSGIGINVYGSTLQTFWLDLSVRAPENPVLSTGNIYLNYSKLDAIVTGTGTAYSIRAIKTDGGALNMVDCQFMDSSYGLDSHGVVDGSGKYAKEVHILPKLAIGAFMVPVSSDMTSLPERARAAAGITSGTVEWNASTKQLKFTNVTQNVTSTWCGITNLGVDNLNVTFSGNNSLRVPSNHVIYSEKNINLTGSSVDDKADMACTSNGNSAWSVIKAFGNLSVSDVSLSGEAQYKTIEGDAAKSKLTISKASIYARAYDTNGMAISGFADCNMTVSEVALPDGCSWQKSLHGFGTGNRLDNFVSIVKPTYYPVAIFGRQVNSVNCTKLSNFEGVTSGGISYDASSKKLILNNVRLDSPTGNVHEAIYVNGVDIELNGNNVINSKGNCFSVEGTVEVTGSGNMKAKSTELRGVVLHESNSKLTLATSGYFFVEAATNGFYGEPNTELVLSKNTLDGYKYGFQGNTGAIFTRGSLTLDNMDYSTISTAHRSDYYFQDNAVRQTGGDIVANSYGVYFGAIQERLGIKICGKELCRTQANSFPINVGNPYITTSSSGPAVTYNPSKKTLTLNDANINYDDANIVESNVDGLTVVLNGLNKFESGRTGIKLTDNTTINGGATDRLDLKTNVGIYLNGGSSAKNKTLTLNGAVLNAENTTWGLCGQSGAYGETLVLKNGAAVKATVTSNGAVRDFASIQLNDGIKVSKPVGARIASYKNGYSVMKGGECAMSVLLSDGTSVFDVILGDVNHDGSVTMADANAVVNYFLATTKPEDFDIEAADVNGDDSITMADANMIVNMFLGGK
jgi:hypothetical protein